MAVSRNKIEKNLAKIRANIADACRRIGRDPKGITIVAVTKAVDLPTVKNLLDAGLTELGENRVPQLISRAAELDAYIQRRRNPLAGPVRWHMIGHLQRNKVRGVLKATNFIHSLDSLRLAEELQERAEKMDLPPINVFLQVNCSQESQKYGCAVGAAVHLGELIATLPHLRLVGLMTMGPMSASPDKTRLSFTRLREIFEEMRSDKIGGDNFRHLSMGMSGDYTIAVEEGATILRIGTALFE
ncbi:MAG: YggS family pyridoxal phosphate-dependent enzyme [Phycisphaerae bacterium]|nr:YggS family pyridoxal phosphate-dependent enzyme [Phycisphaerae bacterium]